jgi:hypothetical protein
MRDPLDLIVAEYFGITLDDVRAMTLEEIEDLRTYIRAQMDQALAEARDLGLLPRSAEGDRP